MKFLTDMLGVMGLVFAVLFPVWPLIVLAPLGWRRGNVLGGMVTLWIVTLVGWALARMQSPTPSSFLIPEPLNTYLFFLAGPVLIVANFAGIFLRRGGT